MKSILVLLPACVIGSKIGVANNKTSILSKARVEKYTIVNETTTPNETTVEKIYDSFGNELSHKDSNGYFEERTFNSFNKELTYKDSNDFWRERTYDSNGNMLTYKSNYGMNKKMISITYISRIK